MKENSKLVLKTLGAVFVPGMIHKLIEEFEGYPEDRMSKILMKYVAIPGVEIYKLGYGQA
ncbi:MAG: hypothetical protein KJ721_00500 [Nanoarchaeota archaeon]|nr:hypothetical protein [Nanoarchaeota archaeon]